MTPTWFLSFIVATALMVPLIAVLNVWLIRIAWRAANEGMEKEAPGKQVPLKAPPPFEPASPRRVSLALVVTLVVLALFAVPTLLAAGVLTLYFFSSSAPAPQTPAERYSHEQAEHRRLEHVQSGSTIGTSDGHSQKP